MRNMVFALVLLFVAAFFLRPTQSIGSTLQPSLVILDTDIGDDIDDAYALALLLRSREVKILGITTTFGNTNLRARLVSRLLQETGNQSIPVFAGPHAEPKSKFTQAAWASAFPDRPYPDAVSFILDTIKKNPGKVTLISIGPMTNIGVAIAKDPKTFRKLQRVVLMGGSIRRGYGDPKGGHPSPEWNIVCDIPAAKALFASGVPLYVMPLDSTQIDLDVARQQKIYARNAPLTNALHQLTQQWSAASKQTNPTLYDAVAAAYTLNPDLCPTTPMRVAVDDKGMTKEISGKPNANVCLHSSETSFYDFFLPRILQ
jgi:inosine-uridine nucleoside N-ribohydrolase